MTFSFTSPVGRMVYGSVWEGRSTDKNGNPKVIKNGPNAGKPLTTWSFGVAVPKVLANGTPNPEIDNFRRQVIEVARAGYPQFFNGPVDAFTGKPGCTHPRMAFKISDGDGVDGDGKQNNQKEGWAGHWIINFSSSYAAPRVFDINVGLDPTQQLQDKTRVLPGDYVAVQGSCDPNTGSETPGVYMNHSMVCFVGGGPRIVTGPKASDAFAGLASAQLPPGCVVGANPANVAPAAPGVPVPPVPGATAVAVPHDPMAKALADGWVAHPSAPGYMYKGQDVKPNADVLTLYPAPFVAPAVPAVPVPPAVPAVPAIPMPPVAPVPPDYVRAQLTPAALAAGFTTYAAAIANNWTDDLLRQNGYLV